MDLKLGCPKCQGYLHGGQILHPGGCPSCHSCVPSRLLNFLRRMTAHLQLSLLKTVDLLLIGSREEPNSMYLSNNITLSFLQLNIYQMLGCKNSINGGKRHAFPLDSLSYLQISQTYRELGAGTYHFGLWLASFLEQDFSTMPLA